MILMRGRTSIQILDCFVMFCRSLHQYHTLPPDDPAWVGHHFCAFGGCNPCCEPGPAQSEGAAQTSRVADSEEPQLPLSTPTMDADTDDREGAKGTGLTDCQRFTP